MFNLTVSEAHTFYVGNGGWLVHNCGNAALKNLPIHNDRGRFYMTAEELLNSENIILKHPTNDLQRFGGAGLETGHGGVRNLTNEQLIKFGGPNGSDPISGFRSYAPGDSLLFPGSRINVEAGHHRLEEIARRIQNGTLDPKTIIEIRITGGK